MKKLYIYAFSMMAISWITTIVFIFILPEQIPMHLNPYAAGGKAGAHKEVFIQKI